MTQEEKELLLKDLCSRLPYGVKCTDLRHGDSKITEVNTEDGLVYCYNFDEYVKVEDCRLYLRPMSTMTEEERKELSYYENSVQITDFYYSHHIDCRFIIEKGLAIEAPENMYKMS